MSSATCTPFKTMYSPHRFTPHTALLNNNNRGHSPGFQFPSEEGLLARKPLRELLGCVEKNPKLVNELASKKNRDERIDLLFNHKLIASKYDLPTQEEVKHEMKRFVAASEKREETFQGGGSACSMIAFGGSYEEDA